MPSGTVIVGSEYRYPEGVQFAGRLVSVKEEKIAFVYKADSAAVKAGRAKAGEKGEFKKWRWTWAFTGEDHKGDTVTSDTDPEVTNSAENKPRQYFETLLGRPMGLGEDFDTDAIVGLPCMFTVLHRDPVVRRDGKGTGYYCDVADVFPPGGERAAYDPFAALGEGSQVPAAEADGGYSLDEPPF